MNPRDVKIRLAVNGDGQEIGRLLESSGFRFEGFDIDWSDIYPHWLVAEVCGEIIGCAQVCPSKPIGRIDLLAVNEDVGIKTEAIAYKRLAMSAAATLKMAGCQIASGAISYDETDWLNIAEKRGWIFINNANLVMKRLRK